MFMAGYVMIECPNMFMIEHVQPHSCESPCGKPCVYSGMCPESGGLPLRQRALIFFPEHGRVEFVTVQTGCPR